MTTPETKAVPFWVDARLDIVSDGVNFEATETSNDHNEGKVAVTCDHNDWFNDSFAFSTYQAMGKFYVLVKINSEVGTGLFNDGVISLSYDIENAKWHMNGIVDGREWFFCEPKAAIDAILLGAECLIDDNDVKMSQNDLTYLKAIIDDIIENSGNIVQSALFYTERADCEKVEPTFLEKAFDTLIEQGLRQDETCRESSGMECSPM